LFSRKRVNSVIQLCISKVSSSGPRFRLKFEIISMKLDITNEKNATPANMMIMPIIFSTFEIG
jgi:hypothetical protein